MSKLAPVKIAIRTDTEAGLIRAYFSMTDNAERYEVSTLSLGAARQVEGLFEKWAESLNLITAQFVREEMGLEPSHFEQLAPNDVNPKSN